MQPRLSPLASVAVLAGALVAALAPIVAESEEADDPGRRALVTPASKEAARRALAWLEEHQKSDGAWHADVGFKLNEQYRVEKSRRPHMGVTALAGTAFLASGSVPGRGPHSENVEDALDWILKHQNPETGYLSANGTRMYSHAFATLFLAEVYGMTNDRRVRDALQRAVEFTYKAQNSQGGWRYVPNAEDSDMSITVCQVMALRAAKNKGIFVPKESIDAAVDYVLNSAVTWEGGGAFEKGAFLYQYRPSREGAERHTRTSFALTAAGLTTLYGAGLYNDDQIRDFVSKRNLERYRPGAAVPSFQDMLGYVHRHYRDVGNPRYYHHYFFFYGNYYATQAMFIAGGKHWARFYPRLRDDLVRNQRKDGSWRSDVKLEVSGRPTEYPMSTAIGAMLLQVPNNYLPIFQR